MLMQGSPPPADAQVTLENWQLPPYNRWSFSHTRELVPTQPIPRGQGPVMPLAADPRPLGQIGLVRADGAAGTVDEVLGDTYTDAAVVVHGGRVVFERYAGETTPDTPHLLMSITKSVVSCVVGNLVERGVLSPGDLITNHVPELGRSGYALALGKCGIPENSRIQGAGRFSCPKITSINGCSTTWWHQLSLQSSAQSSSVNY